MQSPKLQIKIALKIVLAVLVTACAAPTATVPDRDTNMPCPEWTSGQLGLTVSVAPIAVPHTLTVSEGAIPSYGIQARRVSIAVKPPQAASSVRLSASTLSIYIFGGIFRGWVTPADQFADTGIGSKVDRRSARRHGIFILGQRRAADCARPAGRQTVTASTLLRL
jgi:hypothetical protein